MPRTVLLGNEQLPLVKWLTTAATDATFPATIPTATEPTGDSIVDLSGQKYRKIRVMPFGAGADNDTHVIRVIGWNQVGSTSDSTLIWVPSLLASYTSTLSTLVGVSGKVVTDSERFADTLVIVANMGTDAQGTVKVSPADNLTPAYFICELNGAQKVQVTFDLTGTSTSANALYELF